MCTVSIFPTENNDFVLTSNRDETPLRLALQPEQERYNGAQILYPKDKTSSGTWIGISEYNRVLCLLNGAFKTHKRKLPYRTSRGVVVKDLLSTKSLDDFKVYNFENIEPFTLVIVDWETALNFHELVWDGITLHFKDLPLQPHVWSSSTLYNNEMKLHRKQWFQSFLNDEKFNSESILSFHKHTKINNKEFGLVMDRGFVKTTSITQVNKNNTKVSMRFEDLESNLVTISSFKLLQDV